MPGRLTLTGLNGRVVELDRRLAVVERDQERSDGAHVQLQHTDSTTAAAVDKLAAAINDPKTGLIVELASFRTEVRNDRRVFKAYIAGAVAVISTIWAILLVFAPSIQKALGITA